MNTLIRGLFIDEELHLIPLSYFYWMRKQPVHHYPCLKRLNFTLQMTADCILLHFILDKLFYLLIKIALKKSILDYPVFFEFAFSMSFGYFSCNLSGILQN